MELKLLFACLLFCFFLHRKLSCISAVMVHWGGGLTCTFHQCIDQGVYDFLEVLLYCTHLGIVMVAKWR